MTRLRKIMLEELQRRNYSEITTRKYLQYVTTFARHFGKSPDQLGPNELRSYQAYLLQERKVAGPSLEALQRRAALKENQEQINLFAMVRGGMIPRDRFFNPENLLRLGMGPQRPWRKASVDRRLF